MVRLWWFLTFPTSEAGCCRLLQDAAFGVPSCVSVPLLSTLSHLLSFRYFLSLSISCSFPPVSSSGPCSSLPTYLTLSYLS